MERAFGVVTSKHREVNSLRWNIRHHHVQILWPPPPTGVFLGLCQQLCSSCHFSLPAFSFFIPQHSSSNLRLTHLARNTKNSCQFIIKVNLTLLCLNLFLLNLSKVRVVGLTFNNQKNLIRCFPQKEKIQCEDKSFFVVVVVGLFSQQLVYSGNTVTFLQFVLHAVDTVIILNTSQIVSPFLKTSQFRVKFKVPIVAFRTQMLLLQAPLDL